MIEIGIYARHDRLGRQCTYTWVGGQRGVQGKQHRDQS